MSSKIVILILILSINFHAIVGQTVGLSCSYGYFGELYRCALTIHNPNGLNNFATIGGTHLPGHDDSNVQSVFGVSGSITANIPSIICNRFRNAQFIQLERLGIQRIDDYSFNQCNLLSGLYIGENQISYIDERAFNQNRELFDIDIGFNELSTLPENVFANQPRLEFLTLWHNRFTDLPNNIFKSLERLRVLNLRNNQIRTPRPEWFENLHQLGRLVLTENQLIDLPRNVFAPLTSPLYLWISNNNLTVIHAHSFGISNLNFVFWCEYNQIDAIDENLLDNTAIEALFLSGNICFNGEVIDSSPSRDVMRAELRPCFNNYLNRYILNKIDCGS